MKETERRPAGSQEAPKKACWRPRFLQEAVLVHFGVHFGIPFLHMFGSKIGSKFGSVFGVVFGSVLEPEKWPESTQRAFNMALEGLKKRQDELEDATHQKT